MKRALGWWVGTVLLVAAAFAVGVATRDRPSATREADPARVPAMSGVPTAPPSSTLDMRPAVTARPLPLPAIDREPADTVAQARALGVPVPELFEQEARDGAWASAVETSATASYMQTLAVVAPWADRVTVECRTSLCKVTMLVDEARAEATMNRVQVVSIATGVSPIADRADDGQWSAGVYLRFDGDERSSAMQASYWTDGVRARFPGGNPQIKAWLEADERREAERQTTTGTQP